MPNREDSAGQPPSREASAARRSSTSEVGGPHDPSKDSRWDDRIARARQLAAEYPTAADVLTFYTALAEYQKSLLCHSGVVLRPFDTRRVDVSTVEPRTRSGAPISVPILESLDLVPVLVAIPDFLSWLQRVAPARLTEAAAEMRRLDRDEWRRLVHSYLACDGRDFEDADQTLVFVLEALLQPFAEQLAIRIGNSGSRMASIGSREIPPPLGHPSAHKPRAGDPAAAASRLEGPLAAAAAGASRSLEPASRCPLCGGLPVVGVLREEGHGARRALVCALCLTEREYLRVVCPACGEQQFDVLPIYTADQFAHVRIEACDRCRRYLKTIDLTKDGLAVPLVDDIASVSLDLWARDRGYVRLRPNLLRL